MPAYHSQYVKPAQLVGNMGLCPLRTNFKGPAAREDGEDIIDETLYFFKANIFFRSFEIKSPGDRTLMYITFYITECLKRLQRCGNKGQATKEMTTLALSTAFPIPGEHGFPLNAMFKAPNGRSEEDTMRAYLQQVRQETGQRLVELVFAGGEKPSKWWVSFARKRFLDKTLLPPGASV